MRKFAIVALALLVVVAGVYFGSPYWAARSLGQAVQSGDAARIEALSDMTAVRQSLKAQVAAAFMGKFAGGASRGDGLAMLGALVAPVVVDKAVDAYVTPDGIARIVHAMRPGSPQAGAAVEGHYLDLDHFRVSAGTAGGGGLVFERRGFAGWKVVRIDLPADLLGGQGA